MTNIVAKEIMKSVIKKLLKESPVILTTIGVGGVVSTAYLAAIATPKALNQIDDTRLYYNRDLTKQEIIKLIWKYYLPPVASGVMTIVCIIGANSINTKRQLALASAYGLLEAGLKEYQEKIVERIGKNKELAIRDEISQDRLNKDPVSDTQVILTGKGETLMYDSLSGRYFKSDIETIRKAVNDFNHELFTEMYKPLNDFYHSIFLMDTELGKQIGWNTDKLLDIHFSAKIATNGIPCIVLEYKPLPVSI